MTPDALTTAGLLASLPAGGIGLMALLTNAGTAHPLRGPVALALIVWVVMAAYMAVVFAT